jgi:hypothetical protein
VQKEFLYNILYILSIGVVLWPFNTPNNF